MRSSGTEVFVADEHLFCWMREASNKVLHENTRGRLCAKYELNAATEKRSVV